MGNIDRTGKCPIWGTSAEIKNHLEKQGVVIVDSPRAGGKYCIYTNPLPELDDKRKIRLTSWLIKQRSLGVECPRVDAKTINDESYGRALKINERATRLLELIELESPVMGYSVNFHTHEPDHPCYTNYEKMLAWSESTEMSEVYSLLDYLEEFGWITARETRDVGIVIITAAGYTHLEELWKATPDSSKVFVAMWFDKTMSKAWEQGIEPAIIDSGYEPLRIDQTENIGKIDDMIIAEIKRSRFVIADFTHGDKGARGSVYYEAGFAHGLGIPVIFTCREDLINEAHFDTRQYNHIVWGTAEDLRKKLANRISAVIGDRPMKRNS